MFNLHVLQSKLYFKTWVLFCAQLYFVTFHPIFDSEINRVYVVHLDYIDEVAQLKITVNWSSRPTTAIVTANHILRLKLVS